MRKPVAVLVSDIHYNIKNLALSDASMRLAIGKAFELGVGLIVAGDLHDTKANLRGECVKAMLDTFAYAEKKLELVFIIPGNHDRINEKGEAHSLEFLKRTAYVSNTSEKFRGLWTIPYQHDPAEFKRILSDIPKGSTVICHQGVKGALAGEYSFDKSAVDKAILADYRVISGHYHRAQDIKCGPPRKGAVGLMSYIGTPFTMSFAEANDGPKGFQILYDDGLLEQVPTNLRKHVIVDMVVIETLLEVISDQSVEVHPGDLLWVRVQGPKLELDLLSKDHIKNTLSLDHTNFKLDKVPTDQPKLENKRTYNKNSNEIMDLLVDSSGESQSKQEELKALWRKVMS